MSRTNDRQSKFFTNLQFDSRLAWSLLLPAAQGYLFGKLFNDGSSTANNVNMLSMLGFAAYGLYSGYQATKNTSMSADRKLLATGLFAMNSVAAFCVAANISTNGAEQVFGCTSDMCP